MDLNKKFLPWAQPLGKWSLTIFSGEPYFSSQRSDEPLAIKTKGYRIAGIMEIVPIQFGPIFVSSTLVWITTSFVPLKSMVRSDELFKRTWV